MDKIKAILNEGSLNESMGLLVGVLALIILVFILIIAILLPRGKEDE